MNKIYNIFYRRFSTTESGLTLSELIDEKRTYICSEYFNIFCILQLRIHQLPRCTKTKQLQLTDAVALAV